ncbi:MAG: 5-deoxy-glucuronate isomerase [Acidobacteria bacterium]|nr:5-deoxy-glucuronate isomerase [Acidobacteriota bacterium]
MHLHRKSPGDAPGVYPLARRSADLKFLSFTIVELGGSLTEHVFETGEEEQALSFYKGGVRVEVDGWSAEIPARKSLREPGPVVYVPAGSKVRLSAPDPAARIAIAGAPGQPGGKVALIVPADVMVSETGQDNWRRMVYTHIADNLEHARLIAGETVSQPGGWTSCPPHKHDCFRGAEVPMEEIYYFQFEPPQGFGFIRVYTDKDDPEPFDHAFPVEHGDAVLIPRGYHPVSACPGYTLNYLWVMAGEARKYGAWQDDPNHSWIKGV